VSVAAEETASESANRAEIVVLVAYFVTVVAVADVLNVRLGVELLTLVVAVPALAVRRFLSFLRDWWFFLLGLILWNLSGPLAAYSPSPAHLDFMLNADRWLFFGHQPVVELQSALMRPGHIDWLDWVSAASYNVHLPEPYIAGYVLWRLNRALYLQFAASALLLLVVGFLVFIAFPAVPPWMASTRLHRLPHVINGFGPVLHAHPLPFHGTPIFYLFHFRGDAVAAFPSEHAAFPFLELLVFSRFRKNWLTIFLGLWVLWVLFVVVYLGEHWVTDALAGWLLAGMCFAVSRFDAIRPGSLERWSVPSL
jgi:hypothetical protein